MHKIVTSVATLGICLSLTLSVSLLHAQQRPAKRMLAAGLELHRASLSPTRLNQLKLNKARADLPKLRALFSVGPQGVPLYRLADRQQVKLLKPHSGAPFRSISSAQAPASLSRYNDYVQVDIHPALKCGDSYCARAGR